MGQAAARFGACASATVASDAPAVRELPADETARPLLARLEGTAIGRRAADGAIAIRRRDAAGCALYGPYLQLPAGFYRLAFACRCGAPRMAAQPVLGVEVIVLARFQVAWHDFTAAELAAGSGLLDFAVSPEHALGSGNEARFEFRFFHLGNADLAITSVELVPTRQPAAPRPRRWRLLGRLDKGRIGTRDRAGRVSVAARGAGGCLLYGGWPYLRLPRGAYRLIVHGTVLRPQTQRPLLGVEIFGQSRWRGGAWQALLRRPPEPQGMQLASADLGADDLAAGWAGVDFAVPVELATEAGIDAPLDIRLYHRGGSGLTIEAVDLIRLGEQPAMPAPRLRPGGRRRVVMIGNCQMETLRQGFARIEALSSRFEVKYHFVQLPPNLREYAIRDLEGCDILLAQDIRLWDEFPLREFVRPGAEVHRFPLLRLASLWPFDAWNGPGDREAHEREAPNLVFPYLDGLLGRLRREIPDPEARFRAYRALELPPGLPGIVNYRRLHQLEERRLTAMDRQFGIAIGAFVLENLRKRRVLHTTVRPDWQVFSLLLQFMARLIGVKEAVVLPRSADVLLRNPQIPVHPRVARDLGVGWADERTRYLYLGRSITWESYIRSYIAHYG